MWVGAEKRFFEELRMRVGKEVGSSPDLPSSVERLKLTARLISPINSPRPKAARTTSVPSGRVTYTFTLPSRTTYTVSRGF